MARARGGTTRTAALGVAAGVVFGAGQLAAASSLGREDFTPVGLAASLLLGPSAFHEARGLVMVVGIAVHLILSGAYGAGYGALNEVVAADFRHHAGHQMLSGALYGTSIWFVNFHIIARLMWPWFLETSLGLQWTLHAFGFGLPLGFMYATMSRSLIP